MFNLFQRENDSYKNIDAPEFAALMDEKNHVVLDVRTPQEKADGDIPGSILINVFDPMFTRKISELDPEKTYLVFCRSGNRSKTACSLMAKKGFEKLYNLKGGIYAWNSLETESK